MRRPSRFIAFLMAMVMAFTLLPTVAFAATDPLTLRISSETAAPGKEIQVKLSLENNPGIASVKVKVGFGSELTLTNVEFNSAELGGTSTPPQNLTSPVTLSWLRPTQGNYYDDSLFATLTFTVNSDAIGVGENEKNVTITATYDQDNVYDETEQNVPMTVIDGQVKITNYIAGDINGDGVCNQKDLTRLFQHYADWDVWVNRPVMDVNGDGSLNQKDLTRLCQYFADWDVEIFAMPGYWQTEDCEHTSLTLQKAKAATCVSEGNIDYYKCDDCGQLFGDAAAITPIALNETITPIDANNHADIRVIPATETSTEGSKCEACGDVIVEPKPITPEPNTNSITYHIVDEAKHPYLGTLNIDTSSLKYSYTPGQALTLVNLDLGKYGYTFDGWYDGFGTNATQIKVIPKTADEDIELFAHVTENVYDITYNTYQTPVTSKPSEAQLHYTVSKGNSNLYNPEINNYKFLGWYDNNGVEYKTIPVGTTGHITLNAYYTSLRNLAVSKKDDNPLILEDQNKNVVYFTYEIGEIRNIPLNADNPFWTIQSVAGLSQQVSKTYTTSITSSEAASVSKTISDMTVNSSTWTLSESWNDVTTVNETWAESIGKTTQQSRTEATTSSNTLSISDQSGGSSYHKTEDGTTVYDYDSKTETKDKGHQFDASISGTYANKMSANLGASTEFGTEASYQASNAYTQEGKVTADNWSASGSQSGSQSGSTTASDKDKYSSGISYENGFEVNAGLKYGYHNNTNTVTKTGSDSVTTNSKIDENTSSWNNSTAFSATQQHSSSNTISNTLSDIVTTTKGYGSSYSKGGTDTNSQGFSSSSSNTSGTTSTVTYSKLESETTTTTYGVDGKIEGKYRSILVGMAHVFAVVGYDYNTKSYFTYTFSVMDDKTEEFLDYTPKGGNFDDCEYSCLPFEIPIDVFNYVNEKTVKTAGVQFRTNSLNGTAKITGYTGDSTDVIIPAYVSDEKQAYKVTEIANTAFAGKPVRSVVLGEFINSIPNGAFKNCASLEEVIGSFTEIGNEAFAGCVKLTNMNIPSNVVKIGTDAFAGANSIIVRAINSLCAYGEAVKLLPSGTDEQIEAKQKEVTRSYIQSVLDSGAENIVIDLSKIVDGTSLTLEVPAINSIEINGGSKTYRNFSVNSQAKETVLNEMTIENNKGIPLTVGSEKLTLHKVFVSTNNTALVLKKDGAVLSLAQDSVIQSTSNYAIISKNPVIESQISAVGAAGFLNVVGNFGYVNSISGESYVDITNGKLILMSDEEFEKYLSGAVRITFDANGGQFDTDTGIVTTVEQETFFNTAIGTLPPTPTRSYYTFNGWYTAAEGGTKVSADTIVSSVGNTTYYAKWTQNALSDWVKASEVPNGANVEQTKWTYRQSAESSSSTKSGYTLDHKTRTSWGTEKTSYTDPSNGTRNVWTTSEQYQSGSTHHYVYYHRYGYAKNVSTGKYGYVWGTDASYHTGERHTIDLTYALAYKGSAVGESYYGWYSHDGSSTPLWFLDYEYDEPIYSTRTLYHYQDPIYTYYFYKDTETDTADPTGQTGVSNVQKWVRYIPK